jgi:hypothetical protein
MGGAVQISIPAPGLYPSDYLIYVHLFLILFGYY